MNYEELLLTAKKKVDRMMDRIPPGGEEKIVSCCENNIYTTTNSDPHNWTHSFFLGMIAYMYYHYKEDKYLDYLMKSKKKYKEYLYDHRAEIGHDTGFLYSLSTVALYEISGDEEAFDISWKAADEVAKRHHYESGLLQSFCQLKEKNPNNIIDDIMNLSIIIWAHEKTDNFYYEKIYKSHIQAVMDHLMREDYTFRHSVAMDYTTGKILGERNYCGFACGSAWARGQAWAIYGLVNALKHSGNYSEYEHVIMGVLNRLAIEMPENGIPLWDFRLMKGMNEIHDTSAAVIMANAFMRAESLLKGREMQGGGERCFKLVDTIIETIVNEYMGSDEEECIITGGQSGREEKGCIWGDYFFVELIMRKIYGDKLPDFWVG